MTDVFVTFHLDVTNAEAFVEAFVEAAKQRAVSAGVPRGHTANLDDLVDAARELLWPRDVDFVDGGYVIQSNGYVAAPGMSKDELIVSALVALTDLAAGYPWRELGINLPSLFARAKELGVIGVDE